MTAVIAEPVLRSASWDDLARMWHEADTDAEREEVLSEGKRRERLREEARKRSAQRADWEDGARAQYLEAERECRGNLVRRDSPVRDGWALWSGPEAWARSHATEELRNFWDEHPRVTVTAWREQIQAGRRIQRDDRDAGTIEGDTVTETPGTWEAIAAAGRAPSGLTREERYARALARARQDVAERARQYRAAREMPAPELQAQVAVQAPAVLVRQREAVDGAKVLGYLFTFLRRFALWGSDAEIVTAALWIAMTYARDGDGMPIWAYCARLGIVGPSGSGKSWKARLVGKLSYQGEILVEPTKAAFIDLCAERNTVIITEADEQFHSPGRSRGILAVINASYEPDRKSSRKQGGVAVKIPLFTHAVLDGIDDVLLSKNRPDLRAMMSRCIIIRAACGPEGYRPPRFDRQARAIAEMLGQRCAQWMEQEVQDGMADVVPQVPEHLGNRPFALWEPLFTVALRADKGDPEGPWSLAVRDACEQLETGNGVAEADEDTESELDRLMSQWED